MTGEDTLVPPPAWRRARHPRRDRPGVPKAPPPDASAPVRVRAHVDAVRADIGRILALPGTAPEVAEAGRAHLRGEPDPLGAAAVALVTLALRRLHHQRQERLFVDAWIAEHGVVFAAHAYAELNGHHADRGAPEGRHWTGVRPRRPDETHTASWGDREQVRRLRAHLAAAPDDVYAAAVAGLAERRRHLAQRLVTAYLAPTRDDWVEDLCATPGPAAAVNPYERWMLFCALGRPHQPAALGLPLGGHDRHLDVIATLIDGLGPRAALPLLTAALDDTPDWDPHTVLRFLDVLAHLPLDDAFRALVDRTGREGAEPAMQSAARRFPARALRLLPGSDAPPVAELLTAHVRARPELAEALLPTLPDEARAPIRAVLADDSRAPSAPAADLPALLTAPPWTRPREKRTPVVIEGLPSPGARGVVWAPGERADWTARRPDAWWWDVLGPANLTGSRSPAAQRLATIVDGPEDVARPLLAGWEFPYPSGAADWMRVVVGRFELDAHDAALAAARRDPTQVAGILLPLLSDEIARSMAGWLVRLKVAGRTARAWFARHGLAAVPALLPDALGETGPARRAAETALRLIADRHGAAPILDAARVHGDGAAAAIETVLSTDPLELLPVRIPAVPDWANPHLLPRLLLRGGTHALPAEAVAHVLTMLAMSRPDDVYAGVRVVRDICDPDSVAEFGWALFRRWRRAGDPGKAGWAFTQLALTGDDETVRRLAPVIRAWPGEAGHAKAVTGLDVLTAIGTDTALMHLHSISQRVKFRGLKNRAREKMEEVAAGLELTADQLADRLVPDFGLDASGTLTLDYGPRHFTVGFDERLRPFVRDESGKVRKSLPKPGTKDDPESAPAAYKRFAALKKDVRTVGADQVRRLETAMVARRRWALAEWRDLLAGHPLVGHLVRRLVWQVVDGPAFRVAEDGTFADSADGAVTLPETGHVRVPHPLELGADLPVWAEAFADYEILQPFEQLVRPFHTLTADERGSDHLTRFEGVRVPAGALLGLLNRGWERGDPEDAGVHDRFSRRLADGRGLVVGFSPGIAVNMPSEGRVLTLSGVRLDGNPGRPAAPDEERAPRFGDLDPLIVSEVLTDFAHLTSATNGTPR
ncbi:DUF4132 domain-containing protein [Actinomadura sp. LOL_016]|uniref:DUF4132 domain-containing protein n=1 Tax=unclassified Actinomadura TaxID=2626254 RepID=UPI003A7FB2C8